MKRVILLLISTMIMLFCFTGCESIGNMELEGTYSGYDVERERINSIEFREENTLIFIIGDTAYDGEYWYDEEEKTYTIMTYSPFGNMIMKGELEGNSLTVSDDDDSIILEKE